jgi:hypothetical protein
MNSYTTFDFNLFAITVATPSVVCTVLNGFNTAILVSNPTLYINICYRFIFYIYYLGRHRFPYTSGPASFLKEYTLSEVSC